MAFDVIVIGLNTVDVFVRVPSILQRGAKMRINELIIQGGGPAGSAAAVTGRLGFATALVCRSGHDDLDLLMRHHMRRHNISEALIIDDPASRPPCAVIEIDSVTAERTIFYQVDGLRPLRAGDVPEMRIRSARVLLADDYMPEATLHALTVAADHRVPSVLDLESASENLARRLLKLASHVILPLEAARKLTGLVEPAEVLADLVTSAESVVVVTDGARGAWAQNGSGSMQHQPALTVDAVDTSGCGDTFHGAYAVGLLEGWTLTERLEFSAWIAALVAKHIGGRTGIPDREELMQADRSALSQALNRKVESLALRPQ